MTAGSTGFFNDNRRKLMKHEVQRRKLDRRDKKLLKMQERVEARRSKDNELKDRPTNYA